MNYFNSSQSINSSYPKSLSQYDFKSFDLPNLPQFRRASQRPGTSSTFSNRLSSSSMNILRPFTAPVQPSSGINKIVASSYLKEVTNPNDITGRYSISREKPPNYVPFAPNSRLPKFLEHDKRILLFDSYFTEPVVFQTALETNRMHHCKFYFYVEDDTIEIIEMKQQNSGVPQGVFLRRDRIPKNGSTNCFYSIDDFKLGNVVDIYGRKFHIVNCNRTTKEFVLQHHNWTESDLIPQKLPYDAFLDYTKKTKMQRKSVLRKSTNQVSYNKNRDKFLQYGSQTLSFQVVWDDREKFFGDIQIFRLVYHLADDTTEVFCHHDKNNGKDRYSKLLKRCRLAKTYENNESEDDGSGHCSYYHWTDLVIGETINIFGRTMLITKCDSFTRQHFENHGIDMSENIVDYPKQEVALLDKNPAPPPPNGFGSEVDSLRTCARSLNPPLLIKETKNLSKLGCVLRFYAGLISDMPEDNDRKFIILYYLEDDTISVTEPPIPNSGFVGGSFLRRQSLKKKDGLQYNIKDFYIGNIVNFLGHLFQIVDADEYTYKYMESSEKTFSLSIVYKLQSMLNTYEDDIKLFFVSNYLGDGGMVTKSDLKKCCTKVGIKLNSHELSILWRILDKKNKGSIKYSRIIKFTSGDSI